MQIAPTLVISLDVKTCSHRQQSFECSTFLDTGLLPGEAWQVVFSPCALRIHDCLEDGVPLYRQKYQKEGKQRWDFSFSFLF